MYIYVCVYIYICIYICIFICTKAFKFNSVPFVYFCFYFFGLERPIQDNIAMLYVKECFAYVLF